MMNQVIVKCPGSCGEFIQGYYDENHPFLISCPVNIFSYVSVSEGITDSIIPDKTFELINKMLISFGYNSNELNNLKIDLKTHIPIGKGMASSTADLCAIATALSIFLKKDLSLTKIAKILSSIEPTDSLIFPQLTLFNHVEGNVIKQYQDNISCKIVILVFKNSINTIELHKKHKSTQMSKKFGKYQNMIKSFENALVDNNLFKIGSISTESAFLNQDILYKEYLDEINDYASQLGAYGLCIGHSGTVVGILYDDKYFDKDTFINKIRNCDFSYNIENILIQKIIRGGPQILLR